MAELHGIGFAAVLAADAELDLRAGAAPQLTGHLDQLADTFLVDILGEPFVQAFETLKRDEVRRYEEAVEDPSTREVTAWEIAEYLEDY